MRAKLPFHGVVLSLVSGIALWLAFHRSVFFPLAWIALIPYLSFLLKKPSWKSVLIGHGVMVLAYMGGVLYWIPRVLVVYGNLSWMMALVAFLLMLLLLSLFLLPFSLLTRWAAGRSVSVALFCIPGFWLLTELCRNYFLLNGFPWALLGYSQYPYSWIIQVADLAGVYLVSVLVMAGNAAILGTFWLKSLRPLVLFTAVFLAANLYGAYRVNFWQPLSGPSLQVALVQPNIGLAEGMEHYAGKYFNTLAGYYEQAVDGGAQWVIFPEAPNPYLYEEDFYFTTFWQRQTAVHEAYLLFNTTLVERDPEVQYFNSAVLLNPQGKEAYRYHKTHLVPFGEYVPFANWLGVLFEPLVQEVGGFSPGQEISTGSISGTQFATLICYEGIFPELSRQGVRQGAEVLVNITNDSWYGRTAAPSQHLHMAAFRAIETRKPLVRIANSGYSVVIDYLGREGQKMGLFEEGMFIAEVAGNNYRSLYSYTGEWINIFIIGVTILLPLGGSLQGFGRQRSKK
ncbi:MAG: apolipoprotein N-acyltransferase [Acidobacteria bacterium]|nr:apolipoprotein N-acyltransferase [Acidobacteriota bacterium]